mgnify:CR=1 FL=1
MRRVGALVAAAWLLAGLAAAQDTLTVENLPCSLAGEWLFRTGHDPAWASPFRERRYWQRIEVPGAWERQGYPSYNGHAWYRLAFFLPSRFAGETLGLDLGTIGDVDEVFLNGRPVGSTGSPPPNFEKATLVRRFYLIPKEAARYGEYNELAVHVFNKSRFGGFLGPPPRLDRWEAVLRAEVLRDIALWVMASFLLTLVFIQVALFITQREAHEHLTFAAFLLAIGVYLVTYATWGPARLFGQNVNFRINVAALLAAVAVFPAPLHALARRRLPVAVVAVQCLLGLGAAFAVVWRDESDLYFWVHVAELVAVAVAVETLRVALRHLWGAFWGRTLVTLAGLFAAMVTVDILVDVGVVPRRGVAYGELHFPIGLIPFSAVLSFALVSRWAERRWGEPMDLATGLLTYDRFIAALGREMDRSRRSTTPLTVALLRVEGAEPAPAGDYGASPAARVLRRSLRQVDLLARRGDGTFALLLADTEERAAMTTLDRLRRAIVESAAGSRRPATSAGVAQYRPTRHSSPAELLAEAEGALYAAMSEGGNATATAP